MLQLKKLKYTNALVKIKYQLSTHQNVKLQSVQGLASHSNTETFSNAYA